MARAPATDAARRTDPGAPDRRCPRRAGRPRPVAAALSAVAASGAFAACGSATVAELPPAAGPDRAPPLSARPAGRVEASSARPTGRRPQPTTEATLREGSLRAVLLPRARELVIRGAGGEERARATAGVGPTQLSCAPQGPCFVVDTQGDALLVFRVGEGGRNLRLSRRVFVAGAPYAIAQDDERRRLWITLTARNELVELGAHGRPHILQRLPTIRQPEGVAVEAASGDVTVTSATGEQATLRDPASPDR